MVPIIQHSDSVFLYVSKMAQRELELSTVCTWNPHVSLSAAAPMAAHSLFVLDTVFLLTRASL